ncbi:MAG: cation transporter [Chloroflexi bacterium]|nr:cation transporter [Chloroflexota bacterium]
MSDEIRRVDRTSAGAGVRAVYRRAVGIAVAGNTLLFGIKAYATVRSGSSALYSDTANSLADIAYSILMAAGLWLSLRPPDRSHPHGHERIESLVTLGIGLFMGLAGVQALSAAVRAWPGSLQIASSPWFALVPVLTAAVKAGMYLSVRSLGRAVSSPAILASAADHLTDLFTAAVVLVGIVGARFSVPSADPLAGVLVAGWIIYQAAKVVWDGIGQLIGRGASPALDKAILDAIRGVPGVVGIDQVVSEHVGPGLRVDIHVYVDGAMTVSRAHEVSHAVRSTVQAIQGVDHAFVHVEPAADDE